MNYFTCLKLMHKRVIFVYVYAKCSSPMWTANLTLQWRHNGHYSVSIHQPHDCLLNRLFRRISKETSKLCVTGLCAGSSPGPVNSPHKWPVTRNMFPFDDVITRCNKISPYHCMKPRSKLCLSYEISWIKSFIQTRKLIKFHYSKFNSLRPEWRIYASVI